MDKIDELIKTLGFIKDWMDITNRQIEEINKMLSATVEEVIDLRKTVDGITRKG